MLFNKYDSSTITNCVSDIIVSFDTEGNLKSSDFVISFGRIIKLLTFKSKLNVDIDVNGVKISNYNG